MAEIDERRGSAHERGYGRAWQQTRQQVLEEEPLCRVCLANGRVEPATEVDHIIPRGQPGSTEDRANLQPLCGTHHRVKTAAERVAARKGR